MDQKITQNGCIFSKSSGAVVPEPERNVVQLNTLSSRQMDSLTALCDTFLPSIHPNSYGHHHQEANIDDSFIKFLQTSASMNGTPQHIAWMVSNRLQHPKLNLCVLALWLLSTRIGTFIICGKASLSSQFPYLQSFSKVSPKKREEIVKSWETSWFKLLRIFFSGLKILVLLVFFTQVFNLRTIYNFNFCH
ncbi:long-chain-alcohol oxidase FAO4A-like [Lycium ferocissimum]|uniref:long-chain-alcohol oxidase FAO4A-like n=1 Tax=Lycium ferocissimum TaxID=112874 RepID=UPI002815E8F3|nr:long-chain-alcohol oxidase FAO4A-like [Lycium ferocissimum]